jgi:Mg/Co/Ni transporter MgtE
MAPDDAADLIAEVDQDRRLPILQAMPEVEQRKLRALLSYNPETAGGLMSPDFVYLPADTVVSTALEAVRTAEAPPEALGVVFVHDGEGSLLGGVSVVQLVKAPSDRTLGSLVPEGRPAHVHPEWDLGATVRKMSDFNLTVAPVLDHDHHRILGVVTVDDVLELLLPTGWRRDFGPTAPEE